MAGYPKPDDERVTRVKQQFTWRNLPRSGNTSETPALPPLFPDQGWSMKAQHKWAELWSTPQSLMWDAQQMPMLERYLHLYEAMAAGDVKGSTMAAMTQIEDRLGLSPKALLQLRWRIVADHMADEDLRPADSKPLAAVKSLPERKRNVEW